MGDTFRLFKLLLIKNFQVRKKHYILSILVQVIVPIGLFLLGTSARFNVEVEPQFIDHNSYYEMETQRDLIVRNFPRMYTYIKYTPINNLTSRLMKDTAKCLYLEASHWNGSASEEAMIHEFQRDWVTNGSRSGDHYIGIVFQELSNRTDMPSKFQYKLKTSGIIPNYLYGMNENGVDADQAFGYSNPLTIVQLCLDESYINFREPNPRYNRTVAIQKMPYPPYLEVNRNEIMGGELIAAMASIAFLIITCIEVTYPANEKHIGINILMSVNGVKNYLNLLSWITSAALLSFFYLVPVVIILQYFETSLAHPFLSYGNGFIVWIILFIHIFHLISFGFHISAYFWKPSHGIISMIMFMSVLSIIQTNVHGPVINTIVFYAGIISPNLFLDDIFKEITTYETKLIGISWGNVFTPGQLGSSFARSVGFVALLSILGIVFHFFMAIYVYSVRPGKYGIPQSPFFFIQKKKNKTKSNVAPVDLDATRITKREFENVPDGTLRPGVQIRGVKKIYSTNFSQSKVYAVRGISMDFYKGQITSLLGHNGAGKTTLLSILSGLTDPTEGVIVIEGKNILNDSDIISKNIGLCPQENIVFPDLNVQEQLMFFGSLRAQHKSKERLLYEIKTLLAKVNLTDKKNAIPKQLSGGQKRRLCLAMSVIGDGSVIILDEPTSGMDAQAKREVWDIILKLRGDKTIIITTHDMEEADILGDRIAIMHTGVLKSYGTSMFLKKLYGDEQVEVTLSTETWCNPAVITEEIGITGQVLNQDEGKLILAIPNTDNLPAALDKLESSKTKLGITGVSVSLITLEQVFLRVTDENFDATDSNDHVKRFNRVQGFPYTLQTFLGFFLKKLRYTVKNPITSVISLLIPVLIAALMYLVTGLDLSTHTHIKLTLDTYSNPHTLIYSTKEILATNYKETVGYYHGTSEIVDINSQSLTDGLLNYAKKDLPSYRSKVIISAEFNGTKNDIFANGFYSGSATFSIPITINLLSNTLLKTLTEEPKNSIEFSAETLPLTVFDKENLMLIYFVPFMMIILLAPALALYVTQPLLERSSGVKQLQEMTGASIIVYWSSLFFFDLIRYFISVLLLILALVITDWLAETKFYETREIFILILIFFMFGVAVLPFIYLWSFLNKSANLITNVLSLAPLVIGFVELILLILDDALSNKIFSKFREIEYGILIELPYVSFMYGIFMFYASAVRNGRCRNMPSWLIEATCKSADCCERICSNGTCKKPFAYFGTKNDFKALPKLDTTLIHLTASSLLFFGIIILLDYKIFAKLLGRMRRKKVINSESNLDELVIREKCLISEEIDKTERAIKTNTNYESENIFFAHSLSKNYKKLMAVNDISFRVKEGECFGLLGVNGAGKSTTFRMITGDEVPNSGTMYLKKYNISTNRSEYLSEMGYCPQQNALIDSLNAYDHLYLFGRLRGIPSNQLRNVVEKWISKLNLTRCASQPSSTYSGGNKRRLNIGIALIGNPSLVLMDEPTAGVDPAARRSLWNTLKTCQNAGQSIIFTAHSMEECETLCNRLVIMVKGKIVCVGASQELKQRFSVGYNIHIKLSPNAKTTDIQSIKNTIEQRLQCKLIDENTGFIGYHITDPNATWTIMYSLMKNLKNDYDCIEDFAILSSTLEQLFIQFARASNTNNNNNNNDSSNQPSTSNNNSNGNAINGKAISMA